VLDSAALVDSAAWPTEGWTGYASYGCADLIAMTTTKWALADLKPSRLTSPECDAQDRQLQAPDCSGRGLDLELVGQLADLRRRIAAVAAKGLQER
jgi:hypothetical protein